MGRGNRKDMRGRVWGEEQTSTQRPRPLLTFLGWIPTPPPPFPIPPPPPVTTFEIPIFKSFFSQMERIINWP